MFTTIYLVCQKKKKTKQNKKQKIKTKKEKMGPLGMLCLIFYEQFLVWANHNANASSSPHKAWEEVTVDLEIFLGVNIIMAESNQAKQCY